MAEERIKYPRTRHLPWSPGVSSDDRVMHDLSGFKGQDVVITVKMDGENTSIYKDGFHARSLDTPSHPSRDWLWGLHGRMGHNIPDGWRICGENIYAKHSIHYKNLKAHFLVFGIWSHKNECLSWKDTTDWCELLDLQFAPIIYTGPFEESHVKAMAIDTFNGDPCEGYVLRVARSFAFNEFQDVVAKYVRKDHVQTDEHWMRAPVIKNEVAL